MYLPPTTQYLPHTHTTPNIPFPSLASFPANISSLILPHPLKSKSSNSKLLVDAIASVVVALLVVSISAFIYCRRRRNNYSTDDKTLRSDSSILIFPRSDNNADTTVAGNRKVHDTSSTCSEFLYLGTIANSLGIEDRNILVPMAVPALV